MIIPIILYLTYYNISLSIETQIYVNFPETHSLN